MPKHQTLVPPLAAALTGTLLWFLSTLLTSRREPWDTGVYWAVVYPLAFAACGVLGNLWPLGMALFAGIALPAMLAARLAAGVSPHAGAGPAP